MSLNKEEFIKSCEEDDTETQMQELLEKEKGYLGKDLLEEGKREEENSEEINLMFPRLGKIGNKDFEKVKSKDENKSEQKMPLVESNIKTVSEKDQQNESELIEESPVEVKETQLSNHKNEHQPETQPKINIPIAFSPTLKSPTIEISSDFRVATQSSFYFENSKLCLANASLDSSVIQSSCTFRIDNLKYCVGFGIGLKEIIEKHDYTYKSEGKSEMGHGLYLVTSQGFSWSHSEGEEDDIPRKGFNEMYSGMLIQVSLNGEEMILKAKKNEFRMHLPRRIREKYTACFCAYLHEKGDAVEIIGE